MIGADEVYAALTGPIASVSTPFDKDGNIDWKSLRKIVDFIIEGGSRTVLLTCGDSLYTVLTDREIAQVTKTVAEQTAGRAMLVAAGSWWLGESITFARMIREWGVDLFMPLPPDWAGSCSEEGLADYYRAIAAEIPVMLVTALGGRPLPLSLIRNLLDGREPILAVKDDICGAYGKRLASMVQGRCAYLSGGRKQNHLDIAPYGAAGYLSVYQRFWPAVAQAYWQAVKIGRLDQAAAIINTYDASLMEELPAELGLHFDAVIHGCLELFGLAGRWRRNPYMSASDQQMEKIRQFFACRNIIGGEGYEKS